MHDGRVRACLSDRPRHEHIEVVQILDAALVTLDRPSFERRFEDLFRRYLQATAPSEQRQLEAVTTMLGYEYERLFLADAKSLRDAARAGTLQSVR